ncbi:MAG TPA: LamG-like jellyroll fold domain-containing protein [Candidatus Sulfotelmatobacter sp.]|nr:LamG-like jellyroll fold domain-containing protein [Candidatus Sulfotelmatobacter sp.]
MNLQPFLRRSIFDVQFEDGPSREVEHGALRRVAPRAAAQQARSCAMSRSKRNRELSIKRPNHPQPFLRRSMFDVRCSMFLALLLLFALRTSPVHGQGLTWPTNQMLPTFSKPASVLDAIDVSTDTGPEIDLFASLEGIVNRTQPQIVCLSSGDGEGEFTWVNLHNLNYNVTNGFSCILKYRSYVTGLVVTDPTQPDTLNLATTMAGVNDELICDPSLLNTLTNSPYSLPIKDDLRGRFSNKYQVYGYLYTNYWPSCTHRIIAGMETNLDGELRDYLVAVKSATVWLDPGTTQDANLLGMFVSNMTPVNGVYMGWWPSEGNGLTWIANYGIPVLASDFYRNGSVFSGVQRAINIPPIPPPPPLANKVYVSLILSDGDNAQYMEHVMKMWWENPARGQVPIGWTADALVCDLDPVMVNYYWSTASTNDCLMSGPDGAGYAHLELWSPANIAAFAGRADAYLQRSGFRTVTVWDNVTTGNAQAYATNCPTLLGLLDQGGSYSAVNLGLKTIPLTPTYSSTTNDIMSAISNAAAAWNGAAPLFIAGQAVTWDLTPADLLNIAKSFNTNEYQFVRPDHLFLLYQKAFGRPGATTLTPIGVTPGSAILRGSVTGNAANTLAWLEWGTNVNYGSTVGLTNVGNSSAVIAANVSGLASGQIYHYRIVASNTLGMVWGADKQFTTGGRLEVWGGDAYGVTNLPAGLTNVVRIACGANHALALKNDGTVVAWGNNSDGQTNVPAGLANVIDISAGVQHSLALLSNGVVVAWGDNTYGQTNVPPGLTNVVAIAAGGYHNLALGANNTVTAWGWNSFGQTNVPAGLTDVVAVAAGYRHSMALQANGSVTAWGWNPFGQTNVPAGLADVVDIAAGEYDSLALRAAGCSLAGPVPASRWVADSLSGTNGSSVSNWTDVIGGKSATQTVAANEPQLFTNVLNGHSTVRFSSASSQYLTVAATNSAVSGTGDFTLVVVFRTSSPGVSSSSFFLNTGLLGADVPGATQDWSFVLNGSELGAGLGDGSGCTTDFSLYGGNVADGNPHIGAYVRSGNTIRLYVDGVIVAEQTGLCAAPRVSCLFDIGAMTTAPDYFNGDIAEIRIYTQALNSLEMADLNASLADTYGMPGVAGALMSRWTADSLSGDSGSAVSNWVDIVGGQSATQTSTANQPQLSTNVLNGHNTVHFSGGQYLTVSAADSAISGAGSFTMIVVFRTSTAGNASSEFYDNTGLLGADVPGVADDWSFVINGSELGAGLGSASNGCSSDFSLYGGNVTDGDPHIGIYVRQADTITLYVDGAIVASQNGLCTDARVDCPFDIGVMTTAPYYFNGDIAEIQLYDRALTPGEIGDVTATLAGTYGIGGAAGRVAVWGSGSDGQTNVPASLTNAVEISSGSESLFNLALTGGGTVVGWGYDNQGQTNVPASLTNVAAIAAGSTFSMAIGDQTPIAGNIVVSGYINHDLAFALSGSDPDGNPLSFSVASLPAAGQLFQYSAGVRGAPITAPSTAVTDPAGRLIFAPAVGATGNPYANFNFIAQDQFYSSAPAQALINIGLPAAPQFGNVSWNSANGTFALNFTGSSNATYSVWSSTNLFNWMYIGTANETAPGSYDFVETSAANSPQQFFRLSSP